MDLTKSILDCLCGASGTSGLQDPSSAPPIVNEKPQIYPAPRTVATTSDKEDAVRSRDRLDSLADEILIILKTASTPGPELTKQLDDAVSAEGWSEWLAENVFKRLEQLVKFLNENAETGAEKSGPALSEAYKRAVTVGKDMFQRLWHEMKEHPVVAALVVSIIVIGILVLLAPYILELLGFVEEGITEGSLAASWQSTYAGYIPKGAPFSYMQRLGMTWRKPVLVEV